MSEWTVFLVLTAIAGLGVTIITPILKLNTTITKLTTVVDIIKDNLRELTSDNSESHKRLWEKNNEQDRLLADHEGRIKIVERGKEEVK